MLIELRVLIKNETNNSIYFKKMMINVNNIESVSQADNGFEIDDNICSISTLSGDTFLIAMPYEYMVKYLHDSLETKGGLFISRIKEDNISMN